MQSLILTLDAAGVPHRWSTWEQTAAAMCKGLVIWSLGSETLHYGGKSRLTGEISTMAIPTIISVRGKCKTTRRTPPLTNRNLFLRDRHTCAYCGEKFPSSRLNRDHIIPVSRGGKNTWASVVTSCISCNSRKDDKLLSECGMSLLYVPYVPDRAEALIMANRHILHDQMEFLRSSLPQHSRVI